MKLRKWIIILLLVVGLFLCVGCSSLRTNSIDGSGEFVTKTYNELIGNEITIQNIYLSKDKSGKATVTINTGDKKEIVVTAQENIMKYIEVKSKTNKITIDGGLNNYFMTNEVKIDIYGYSFNEINLEHCNATISGATLSANPELEFSSATNATMDVIITSSLDIDLSGASCLKVEGITTTSMDLDMSGASNFECNNFISNTFDCDISGASQASLAGSSKDFEGDISGASSIEGEKFVIDTCEFNLSGASKVTVEVNNKLKYEASGASMINYYGEAETSGHVSGGSKLNKKTRE